MRFHLFVGTHYYPAGGWNDYVGSYGSYEEAQAALLATEDYRVWHEEQ